MSRYRRRRGLLRHIVTLLVIPVLLTSATTYALFSTNLTINGDTADPVYVATQSLKMTYTKTITQVSGRWNYSVPITIRNNGPTAITSWQLKIDLPADFTNRTCPTSVTCSMSGQTLTIVNGTGNGSIAAGATRSFTISFRSLDRYYTLQNIYLSGTNVTGYQTITGLTVARAQGTRTRVGSVYRWPITFTITNSSGFDLSSWQITVPWTTARSVISLDPGVTYVVSGSSLLITSTQPILDGEVYVLNGVFGSTATNWTIGGTIKGMP